MMDARRIRTGLLVFSLLAVGCLYSTGVVSDLLAQEKPAADEPAAKKRAKASGRLPNQYGKVVTPDQRKAIYEIQRRYAPGIQELEDMLATLEADRDEEIRGLLTPAQQKQLDEYVAAAKAKREKARQKRAAAAQKSGADGK